VQWACHRRETSRNKLKAVAEGMIHAEYAGKVRQLGAMLIVLPPSRASPLPPLECVRLDTLGTCESRACPRRGLFEQHKNQLGRVRCWLCCRLRGQARSHSWNAIVRIPMTHVGAGLAREEAVRTAQESARPSAMLVVLPPSRASPLPQLECVRLDTLGTCESRACPRRGCSNSTRISSARCDVDCAAAFAGKPAPTVGMRLFAYP